AIFLSASICALDLPHHHVDELVRNDNDFTHTCTIFQIFLYEGLDDGLLLDGGLVCILADSDIATQLAVDLNYQFDLVLDQCRLCRLRPGSMQDVFAISQLLP